MNNAEFIQLHAECVIALRDYFDEAGITTGMLAKCTADPLAFTDRMNLLAQEVIETNAQTRYASAKLLLHDAARLGYGFLS
jgi:hypothetical protein